MNSDLTYIILMHAMALAVLVTCGAGIAWGYVSEGRWGARRGEPATGPQKATGVLTPRPSTGHDQEHEHRLAA